MAKKILIIDDNKMNRKLFRFLLEKAGYEVFDAGDGEAGVRLAVDIIPHLVILDVKMPGGMDGIAVLKALRENNSTSAVPVIVATSNSMKGDRERFLAEGFVDYIAKPIDNALFLSSVKITLERYYG